MQTSKACTKCGEVKLLSEFPICRRMTLGVGSWCRKCKGKLDAQYSKDNPEKYKKIKRKYYDSNKEKSLTRSIQWDRDNPQKATERHERWFAKNPHKKRLYSHNRRSRIEDAPGRGLTDKDWEKILEFYGKKCLKCGSTNRITIDHVVPLFVGGWHDPINIQPLCHSCNSGKRDRIADYRPRNPQARAWLVSQFG